jgi:hypothetical protein
MIDNDRQIESLIFVAKRTNLEARRVAIRLFATSLVPFSSAHITLKARRAVLFVADRNGRTMRKPRNSPDA